MGGVEDVVLGPVRREGGQEEDGEVLCAGLEGFFVAWVFIRLCLVEAEDVEGLLDAVLA